jgi:hypothetical protein
VEQAALDVEAAAAVEQPALDVEAAAAVEQTALDVEAAAAVEQTALDVEAAAAVEQAALAMMPGSINCFVPVIVFRRSAPAWPRAVTAVIWRGRTLGLCAAPY